MVCPLVLLQVKTDCAVWKQVTACPKPNDGPGLRDQLVSTFATANYARPNSFAIAAKTFVGALRVIGWGKCQDGHASDGPSATGRVAWRCRASPHDGERWSLALMDLTHPPRRTGAVTTLSCLACPMNALFNEYVCSDRNFSDLINWGPGLGTELIGHQTACSTNTPVRTVFFEDFIVR